MATNITKKRIMDFALSLKVQQRSANTITSYTTNIRKLELFLDGKELTKEQILAYKKWLSDQGFKQRTINAYLAAVNQFCDVMGWKEMKVVLDPISQDVTEETRKQMSSSSYGKIVYTALQNGKERLAMMIQVLFLMDLRFCELERFTVEALEKGEVDVVRKHQNRKIPIPEKVLKDLLTYIRHEQIISGIIFRTSNGAPIDRSNFRKDIKKICVLAGVEEELGSIQHLKNVVMDESPYYGLKKWE